MMKQVFKPILTTIDRQWGTSCWVIYRFCTDRIYFGATKKSNFFWLLNHNEQCLAKSAERL